MKKKRRRIKIGRIILLLTIIVGIVAGVTFGIFKLIDYLEYTKKTQTMYLASKYKTISILDEDLLAHEFVRGTKVEVKEKPVKIDDAEYREFVIDDVKYHCSDDVLVSELRDCVKEDHLYTLRNSVITKDVDTYLIADYVKKNTEVSITGYKNLLEDGSVDYYEVNGVGYLSSDKLDYEYHKTSLDSSIYSDAYYYGGDPTLIDYYEKQEVSFEDNKMPDVVRALYINAEGIRSVDSYIELAKGSDINAFVVDIKDSYDDTQLAYDSPLKDIYAPSTSNIPNKYDDYKGYIKKLKDAGFYVIGRITAFKDDAFAYDNPSESLTLDGETYHYAYVYWPSIFSRKLWEYDVALGLEGVKEMGFDEIQYDYVRMPERVPEATDTKNKYSEGRAEAITEFLRYACEQIHLAGAYVSADVFGEISGWTTDESTAFVTSYGQFWPAISNVVDAISSMPYPDHFSGGSFGVSSPWANPGDIMYEWAKATYQAQKQTYSPAKVRTWIQAQDSDAYDIDYGQYEIKAQIDALKDADVYDGFMTWNAAGSLRKYREYIDVLN